MERDLAWRGREIISRKDENGRTFYINESTKEKVDYFQDDLRDIFDGYLGQIKSLAAALNPDGEADPTFLFETLLIHIDSELEKLWSVIMEDIGEIRIDRVYNEKSGGYVGEVIGTRLKTSKQKIKKMVLTAADMRESEILADFMADTRLIRDDGKTRVEDLWDLYKKWHRENIGGEHIPRTVFDRLLKLAGYIKESN